MGSSGVRPVQRTDGRWGGVGEEEPAPGGRDCCLQGTWWAACALCALTDC